jgi:hypothetical protein
VSGEPDLLHIADAHGCFRRVFGLRENRKQYRSEDGYDRDNDEQFDKREGSAHASLYARRAEELLKILMLP